MMTSKIGDRHLSREACIYVRQSTPGQVRFNQESTERQYNLASKAQSLGWSPERIRILDRDLGQSGARTTHREDFKALVSDVAMSQVGAIFSLEVSRLARSNQDWHRLLELCAITGTLVIDEDGCYDPAEFNDGLVLGMKGTFAQAELHIIRARLHGGKLNKAHKGELRFPLPVGFVFDADKIALDPDQEVQGAVRMVFELFERENTAYAVVQRFQELGLRFPRRSYGGAWDGKLLWGRLTHSRLLGILANPSYAGTYVFGRYQSCKQVGPTGEISTRARLMPRDEWRVVIPDHHPGYITWDQFLANRHRLAANRTNGEVLAGPAREGLCLLQGLLVCGICGRRLASRYIGNGGLYPVYNCNWKHREALARRDCLAVSANAERVLVAVTPLTIELALIWDITVVKGPEPKRLRMHIRWQGGATETLELRLSPNRPDVVRYPDAFVARIRALASRHDDHEIIALLDRDGLKSSTGKPFTISMIRWIRYKHRIFGPSLPEGTLNVRQVRERYSVSMWVVYYWIERGLIDARRRKPGLPYAITISDKTDRTLRNWVAHSGHLPSSSPKPH
jgi:DNA invertase Pin-like site-specific DNA recombinase